MIKKLIQVIVVLVAASVLAVAQPKAQQQAPKGKGITKKEQDALNAVMTAKTPDERIAAAENLVTNFADTEFKAWALEIAAEASEQKNDTAKALFYADRSLEADPKYVPALIVIGLETAGHTRENDLDRDDKLAKAEKAAKEALDLLPNEAKPAYVKATDAQWEASKKDDAARAHVALGLAATVRKKYDDAAKEFDLVLGDPEVSPDERQAASRWLGLVASNRSAPAK